MIEDSGAGLEFAKDGVDLRARELDKLPKGQPCHRSALLEKPRPIYSGLRVGNVCWGKEW